MSCLTSKSHDAYALNLAAAASFGLRMDRCKELLEQLSQELELLGLKSSEQKGALVS